MGPTETTPSGDPSGEEEQEEEAQPPEPDTTLFVKNLNFTTTQAALKEVRQNVSARCFRGRELLVFNGRPDKCTRPLDLCAVHLAGHER